MLITVNRSATFSSIIMEVPNFELCTITCCDLENTFFTTFLEIWVRINARVSSEIYVVQVLKMPLLTVIRYFIAVTVGVFSEAVLKNEQYYV